MKTEKTLRTGKNYSWFYLLFALGLIFLTIFSTPYTQGWVSQSFVDSIFSTTSGGALTLSAPLTVWIVSLIYLLHFLYGFLYYPAKYQKYLQANKVDAYYPNSDWSYLRGILPTGIILALLWTTNSPSFLLAGLSLVWLLVNCTLFYLTRTYHLFAKSSVFINKGLLPEEDYRPGSANKKYTVIKFYWPKLEDKGEWENRVVLNAIKEYNQKIAGIKATEDEREKAAEEKTREILSSIK